MFTSHPIHFFSMSARGRQSALLPHLPQAHCGGRTPDLMLNGFFNRPSIKVPTNKNGWRILGSRLIGTPVCENNCVVRFRNDLEAISKRPRSGLGSGVGQTLFMKKLVILHGKLATLGVSLGPHGDCKTILKSE